MAIAKPVIIDGVKISDEIKSEIAQEVKKLHDGGKRPPHLVAVLVGEDGASKTYVASKEKASHEVGFFSTIYRLPEESTEAELVKIIDFLNHDEEVDGYIVQLPLPKHINESRILSLIDPEKDVDGFHPSNVGKMIMGLPTYLPATPYGIMTLLQRYKIEVYGKNCVVLGRSNIVGRPMANLLSQNTPEANGTVTLCHSKTQGLKEITQKADILIVAIGQPEFVTADMVKEGATVIDVGIHRIADESNPKGYRIVGDVKFDEVKSKCSAITPVPGGVGKMTIVSLLLNTLKAYKNHTGN